VEVVERLRQAGHVAYFAGGCVRDELMGREPKDFDVATDAPPIRVRELFRRTQAVGAAFGVILVRQGPSEIQVATFRTDDRYLDGRHPEAVHFTDAQHDAQRRDFTINGLFLDPVENRVIDFVGGQEDLKKKVIRAIGEPNHRFEEDHLRLLRAVRFAARLGFEIEGTTVEAIRKHAEHLKRISPERIAEELRLMLTPGTRVAAYRMLGEFGLDRIVLRFLGEVGKPVGVFEAIGEETISFGLALAGMVLDARGGKLMYAKEIRAAANAMRQALRISNEELEEFEGALSFAHLIEGKLAGVATMKRFLARPTSGAARTLMGAMERVGLMRERIASLQSSLAELGKTEVAPVPWVTGDDLTGIGMKPGPAFKKILDGVYDAQLEGRVKSKGEAMEMAKALAR